MEGIQDLPKTLLSQEQMEELILSAQQGDEEAKNILVQHNLRLVLKIIQRFKNKGYEEEDLFQIGTIGLLQAIHKFDLSKGVKFSTYAVPLIIGEIRRFIRDDAPIRVSRSLKDLSYQIRELEQEFRQEYGYSPAVSEIADRLNLPPEEVVAAIEGSKQPLSIYQKVETGEGDYQLHLFEQLADTSLSRERILDRVHLSQVIHSLSKREKKILFFRFFQERSQEEIGALLGLSQVQISRLEKKILAHLRSFLSR